MRHAALALALIAQVSMLGAGAAAAQTLVSEPQIREKQGKELHAFRIRGEPPHIDGKLDEEVWQKAQSFEDFIQTDPDNGSPATEQRRHRLRHRLAPRPSIGVASRRVLAGPRPRPRVLRARHERVRGQGELLVDSVVTRHRRRSA